MIISRVGIVNITGNDNMKKTIILTLVYRGCKKQEMIFYTLSGH